MRPWPRPPGTTAGGIRHGRRPSRTWLAVRCGDSRHSAGCAGLRVTLQLMEGRVRNSTRTVSVRAVVAGRRAGRLRVLHPITGDPDQTTGPTDTLVQEGEVSSRPTFPRMGNQPTAFLPAGGRVRTVSGTAVERKPGGDLLFGCGRRQLPLTTYSTSGHPHHPVGRRPGDACVLSPYHLRARRFSIRCRGWLMPQARGTDVPRILIKTVRGTGTIDGSTYGACVVQHDAALLRLLAARLPASRPIAGRD